MSDGWGIVYLLELNCSEKYIWLRNFVLFGGIKCFMGFEFDRL